MKDHATIYLPGLRRSGRSLLFLALMLLFAAQAALAQQPAFIRNDGQWDSRAKFLLRSPGLDLWITGNGVVYDLSRMERLEKSQEGPRLANTHDTKGLELRRSDRFRITRTPVFISFEGARGDARTVGSGRRPEYHNYYIGNDPARWAEHVPLFGGARVEGLYDGIDALFYLDEGRPRYDLLVAPGADPSVISMKIEGSTGVSVAPNGSLRIATTLGTIEQRELFAYQVVDGRKRKVECAFVARADGHVRFALGGYDRGRSLVIDPVVYSTYFGGSNADAERGIAADEDGNAYVAGYTNSSNFPTLNATQTSYAGNTDLTITKLSSSGAVSWSTFYGGTLQEESEGIAVDGSGNVLVTGWTASTNFPTSNAAQGTKGGEADAFAVKLSGSGTRSWATYLGGNDEDWGQEIAVDGSGNAYITGFTLSTNFPTSNALQSAIDAGYDAFVTKLSSAGAISWSTYLGGNDDDKGVGIAVDGNANVYVTGYTVSTNFYSANGFQTTKTTGSDADAFITKMTSGGTITWSTYMGGNSMDVGYSVAVDGSGNVHVAGSTLSSTFPTLNAAQTSLRGSVDLFIAKIASDCTPAWSTYHGGSGVDLPDGIAVDGSGNVFITGLTESGSDFPILNAIQSSSGGGSYSDAFIVKMTAAGARSYSTYYGGDNADVGSGIALDGIGGVYIAGHTSSTTFPTLNALQSQGAGSVDGFIAKIAEPAMIEVLTPDATASICAGSTLPITWNVTSVRTVAIDVSSNGGSSWTTISSGVAASARSYSWTIPGTQSGGSNYRVRLRDSANATVADTSSGSFTIRTAPVATLTSSANPVATAFTSVTFVSTSAAFPVASVQWQVSTNGVDFTDLPGDTSASLTLASVRMSNNQKYYRAVHTNSCGTSTTTAARLTVNRATATVTLGSLSQVYSGSARFATATTTPAGLRVDFTYTRNGAPVASPTNAGSYTVTATINDSNYTGTATGTLVISKATAPITLGALNQAYDGNPKSVTATTTPPGLTVNITYTQNGNPVAAPTAVGSYQVTAAIEDSNYTGTATGTLVISKGIALVDLAGLSHLFDGSPKGATATTTPAGLTVEITYAQNGTPVTAPTAVGSYDVTATVVDPSYEGAAVGTLVIGNMLATVTLADLNHVYDGRVKAATATTNPAGLPVVITYSQNGRPVTGPTDVGSYSVVATVNDGTYVGSATGRLVIARAQATITLGNLNHLYDGSAKAATATTTPAGLAVTITYSRNGSPVAAPTAAGSYDVTATIADSNYQGTVSGTLVIGKATATVVLSNLTHIHDGAPKRATATTTPAGLSVDITYARNGTPVTEPVEVGSYDVTATINDPNYTGSATGTLVIDEPSIVRSGREAIHTGMSARVFPNPLGGIGTLRVDGLPAGRHPVTIHDIMGRTVQVLEEIESGAGGHALPIDLRSLPSGLYTVRIVTRSGVVTTLVQVVR